MHMICARIPQGACPLLSMRRAVCARLALILSAYIVATFPVGAEAQPYFSGHVSDSQGNPLADIHIEAGFHGPSGTFIVDGQAVSDAQGNYAITSLDGANSSAQYTLLEQTPGFVTVELTGSYAPPATGIDFLAVRAASIAGTVQRADTSAMLVGIDVDLTAVDQSYRASGKTDEAGAFSFDGLPPNSYYVGIYDNHGNLLTQEYPNDFDLTYAFGDPIGIPVPVVEGEHVSGIDFALHPGAVISGTLLSAIDSAPVKAQVFVLRKTPQAGSGYAGVAFDAVGSYQSTPLVPGSIVVKFSLYDDYAPLFYNGVSSEVQAQQISLAYGQVASGVNAVLTPKRTIAGTVTDAGTGLPLSGVSVHAISVECLFTCWAFDLSDATTDGSGHYLLQGLDASGYLFYIAAGGLQDYRYQLYPDVRPWCCDVNPDQTAATALSLGDVEQKTGIDLALLKGAYVSGRVYDPDTGFAAANMPIQLFDSSRTRVQNISIPYGSNGTYHTPAFLPGSYYLGFAFGTSFVFYPDYVCAYPDCSFDNAQLLDFSLPQEYQNFDFAVPHLDLIFRGNFD